ncbi:MAG: cobyrinate a,c-diamide synthase [Desulfuromonadales bacterium]
MNPLIIAAPSSGCGKTTVTLGLLAALRRRGLSVAPFKVGPDFIDPGHHAVAAGRVSRNLDGWMCDEERVRRIYRKGCADADLAVVEGVMGLFDGAAGDVDAGSTAEIARWLDGRIVLVVDARSQARSAAALVQGFCRFDRRLRFAGILFNRVGSPRHAELLRQAVASVPGLPPVLGCLPRAEEFGMPERHLGLVTAADLGNTEDYFARLADWVEKHAEVAALLNRENPQSQLPRGERVAAGRMRGNGARVRIGVARDEAFCFYYQENLEMLVAAGAELVFFSPLRDGALPAGIQGLYLGGGYPELHAERLAANAALASAIHAAALAGLPIYAECGGLVYLGRGMREGGGEFVGIFPAAARMLSRRRALGYREVTLAVDCPLGPAGTVLRGHEFHYSAMEVPASVPRVYRLSRRGGEDLGVEGYLLHNVLGSYIHLHFGSHPQVAAHFVEFCRIGRPPESASWS